MKASDSPFDTWPVAGIFQEHPLAPQMAIIPAGTYTMGSPLSEASAFGLDNDFDGKETERQVTFAEPLAVGRFAVTRREFRAFVEATRFPIPDQAYTVEDDGFRLRDGRGWRNPGFAQDDNHPVVSVSWYDAVAYIAWLNIVTGSQYRLLFEAEWEYTCRCGSQGRYFCGESLHGQANYKLDKNRNFPDAPESGVWQRATAPVDSFRPNRWGLSQMHGNVFEWCADSWHLDWSVQSDRRANLISIDGDDPNRRVIRGGSWNDTDLVARSAHRGHNTPTGGTIPSGFVLPGCSKSTPLGFGRNWPTANSSFGNQCGMQCRCRGRSA